MDFINVGYGEAIVARSGDYTLVIDGGPAHEEGYRQQGTLRLADYLRREGIRRIDCMIVTHIHEDHIAGLVAAAELCEVGKIWCNVLPQGDPEAMLARLDGSLTTLSENLYRGAWQGYVALFGLAQARGIPTGELKDGDTLTVGTMQVELFGMTAQERNHCRTALEQMLAETDRERLLEQYHTNDACCNATSLAMRVSDGAFHALLTGDKVDGWEQLRQTRDLRAQVLKITHHGQRNGMAQDMLEGADPEIIVICADCNRTFHSADPEVIGRAEQYMAERKRFPKIFITGRLYQGDCYGSVLSLSDDADGRSVIETVKM